VIAPYANPVAGYIAFGILLALIASAVVGVVYATALSGPLQGILGDAITDQSKRHLLPGFPTLVLFLASIDA